MIDPGIVIAEPAGQQLENLFSRRFVAAPVVPGDGRVFRLADGLMIADRRLDRSAE